MGRKRLSLDGQNKQFKTKTVFQSFRKYFISAVVEINTENLYSVRVQVQLHY